MRGSGSKAVVSTLQAKGVQTIFGLPGAHIMPLYDALYDAQDIRRILVRNEQGASFMALGHAMASGEPSVCILSPGPGATNSLTGVAEAYKNSMPVVVISGLVSNASRGKDGYHDVDQMTIFRTVTKWQAEAKSVDEVPRLVSKALAIATEGRPRPTYVQIPFDVLKDEGIFEVPDEAAEENPSVSREEARKVVGLLMKSQRPIMIAGGGVVTSGGWQKLQKFAETLWIPVATTYMGRGVMPEDHPLSLGNVAGLPAFSLVGNSDCVLAIGCRLSETSTLTWRLKIPERLIHVDIDPSVLGMTYPPELGLVADAGDFLETCLSVLKDTAVERTSTREWLVHVTDQKKGQAVRFTQEEVSNRVPLNPHRVMKEMTEVLPRNSIVVSDAGTHGYFAQFFLKAYQPRSLIAPAGNWAMGFGLLASIGVKCAKPHSPVLGVVGEGGFMMSCQDLITAAEYRLPVVIAVFNNQGYASLKNYQKYVYGGRYIDSSPMSPDFLQLAKSMGLNGFLVERPGETGETLKAALESEKPCVIDIRIDPTVEQPRDTMGYMFTAGYSTASPTSDRKS